MFKQTVLATAFLLGLTACGGSGSTKMHHEASNTKPKPNVQAPAKPNSGVQSELNAAVKPPQSNVGAQAKPNAVAPFKPNNNIKPKPQDVVPSDSNNVESKPPVPADFVLTKASQFKVANFREQDHDGTLRIGNKTFQANDDVRVGDLGETGKVHELKILQQGKEQGRMVEATSLLKMYRQNYSVVSGLTGSKFDGMVDPANQRELSSLLVQGQATPDLPKEGQISYEGKALHAGGTGALKYQVDFGKRMGSGVITGLGKQDIQLQEGKFSQVGNIGELDNRAGRIHGISGGAMVGDKAGGYQLGFFGSRADEIAGVAHVEGAETEKVIFGGARK